jgi:hypothetical protein
VDLRERNQEEDEENFIAYKISVGKSEENLPLRRPLCRHKDNTKVDHRKWDVCA